MLADLMADFLGKDGSVKVGPLAFDVVGKEVLQQEGDDKQRALSEKRPAASDNVVD